MCDLNFRPAVLNRKYHNYDDANEETEFFRMFVIQINRKEEDSGQNLSLCAFQTCTTFLVPWNLFYGNFPLGVSELKQTSDSFATPLCIQHLPQKTIILTQEIELKTHLLQLSLPVMAKPIRIQIQNPPKYCK